VSGLFRAGEVCLLLDGRGRSYLIDLSEGGRFGYHGGALDHREIIGRPEGTVAWTTSGARLVALRPRLADYVLRMKRGPQVVYPKDIGAILVWGDIGAGMTVLEAGTGSGALTLALLRAVGPGGRVVSVERREEHASFARTTIHRLLGGIPDNLDLRVGEVEDAAGDVAHDRLVLDLPEPWQVAETGVPGLADGGVFVAYVPTVPQVQRLHDALRRSRRFFGTTAFEVLHREWVAEGRSVRPSHHMVAHTGFVTVARHTLPLGRGDDAEEPETT
jgi:tRNA (adenine57-N1/adenine58-N1)-methyltransferase